MSKDEMQSHIEDILDVLSEESEKDVNREELEKELKKFLEYGVPIDQAKQTLIKKFGGSVSFDSPSSSDRKMIIDLEPNEQSINLLCRVIFINPKEIQVKGESRKIFYGIFGDESGTVPFTAWKDFEIQKGDVLEISNAYSKEWQGTTQVNLGDRVKIKKTDKSKLSDSSYEPKEFKIIDLRAGLGAVEVTARILDLTERETEVNGEKKKIFSGIIGDDSGKAQFTSWHDYSFKEGDVFKISGGYVKSWKGIPQLTFDDKASVKKLDKDKIPKSKIKTQTIPIHVLVEKGGALDVEIVGTIIEVREGSGYVLRCPECNRVLFNDKCSIHGDVEGKPDMRIKLVVDDGTGSVNTIINREIAEKLLNKTLDEYKKIVEKSNDQNVLIEEINKLLFAKRIKLQGNALGDSFGTTLITKDAQLVDVNVKDEAAKLNQELEELQ